MDMTPTLQLSVILCTHNPRPDYLRRTLAALEAQTLAQEKWELLLVDNASTEALAKTWNLSWHSHARHVREDELGITHARVRGIKESKDELLVFVDDDTLLAADYLARALATHQNQPHLGAFGAGRIVGEFATAVPKDVSPFLAMLALRDEPAPAIANARNFNRSIPYGAGLCVRRVVALDYAAAVDANERGRRFLGRRGPGLSSCEDVDLALFACNCGLFTGVFPELVVTHLIPANRLEPQYLVRLAEGHAASHFFLAQIWGYEPSRQRNKVSAWFHHARKLVKLKGLAREIYLAERRGQQLARSRLAAPPVKHQNHGG
jgi:glycosyltransferase involved in cell wall biosynthesis